MLEQFLEARAFVLEEILLPLLRLLQLVEVLEPIVTLGKSLPMVGLPGRRYRAQPVRPTMFHLELLRRPNTAASQVMARLRPIPMP